MARYERLFHKYHQRTQATHDSKVGIPTSSRRDFTVCYVSDSLLLRASQTPAHRCSQQMLYGGWIRGYAASYIDDGRRQKGIVCQQRAADKGTSSVPLAGNSCTSFFGLSLSTALPPAAVPSPTLGWLITSWAANTSLSFPYQFAQSLLRGIVATCAMG